MFECQYTFVKTKAQEISIFPTHNLEVPGSSPGWSTRNGSANCKKSSSWRFSFLSELNPFFGQMPFYNFKQITTFVAIF